MKKIFLFILLFSSFSLSLFADGNTCIIANNDPRTADMFLTACGANTVWLDPGNTSNDRDGVKERIKAIANVAISFWALLAVGAIVWAGIQYTKAYGEDENIKKAKTTGIYAVIGLVLLMASFGLVDIFINFIYRVSGQG